MSGYLEHVARQQARHVALVECAEVLKRALGPLPVAGDYDTETGITTVPYSSREWSELVAVTSAAKNALARLDEVEGSDGD